MSVTCRFANSVSQPDLAARALTHVTETKEAARDRIQRENAELFVWRQQFVDRFDAKPTYVRCELTGREWGKPMPGRAVQASASPKPGKPLKERR